MMSMVSPSACEQAEGRRTIMPRAAIMGNVPPAHERGDT